MTAARGSATRKHRRFGAPGWWCALPDVAAADSAVTVLRSIGTVTVRHRSGRAWIMAHPDQPPPEVLAAGRVMVAIIGPSTLGRTRLSALRAAASAGDLDSLMADAGDAHVVLAEPGRVRAASDAAGFRRLFTTRYEGVPVVASHADVLRRLVDAPLDRAWIAAKLASPEMPHSIRHARSPFIGVDPVPAGHLVEVEGQRVRTRPWWRPPCLELSLADGAGHLRTALRNAVGDRVASAEGPVSMQLSGGLDSTALACLAGSAAPLLVTTAGSSPVDDDLAWARRVAAALPGAEHRVFDPRELPLFFADLDQPLAGMDEPCSFTAGAARQRYVAAVLAEHRVDVHFNGQGGDEVLLAPTAFLVGLPRARRSTWRQIRGHAALRGVPVPALVSAILHHPSYPAWLRHTVVTLRREAPVAAELVAWEAAPLLPAWASVEAEHLVADLLTQTEPVPVAADAGMHAAVVRVRASAYRAAMYRDAMAAAGAPTAMPFLDHTVMDACLAVRPEQRTDPWQPKPLLRQALRDVVPEHLLSRRTKGFYNHDIYRGWKANRDQVRGLLADSRLTQLGLVDESMLRRELATFGPTGLPPAFVTDLIALETWLRDLTPALPRAGRPCA
ncbi:asparagine synthase-related protein [Amycolatopsis sp. NPDC004378]